MATIMVAMSGGVDSSLTAALLHEQGHTVVGVTMHLWDGDDDHLAESLCCSLEMTASARRVCNQLGIPYYVFNYQREFRRAVVDAFVHAYSHGYTPNPCIACNREIKFRALLARANQLGYDYVATGHYVRRRVTDANQYKLLRAHDHGKDQSYVLYMLGQTELARLLFPLGEYQKSEVRAMATARGLESADRPESQDICFVPDGDYRQLLRTEAPASLVPGPIVDQHGREVGQHQGLPLYTIGQRRGLGVYAATPLYVTGLDTARNTLIVGPAAALLRHEFWVEAASSVAATWPESPFTCEVQVRAHGATAPATVTAHPGERLHIQLQSPIRAISPGQAAVLYAGERVIGGGTIARPEAP
ncbi:tRNA (5-methylaminomethyl-2-thiouridylate)-methyltransferase [Oscillochloris trichoides DG-6]|uniref:tRNA-specific 2-thiouridylase MnmA n=1 Tax=Oscillochloris trichoides DG-6 TaxID=765420 RepID=E1ICF1_9CHLR|nr:tRNA 2-thiouridine(34) synthase MnmA [Oscillochloris trichoides]EFO81146.1 tRNA (5-methylaminomethyl-2-thiouridylate)-methyltransferase [Oscillochloris trichoides DG-6]